MWQRVMPQNCGKLWVACIILKKMELVRNKNILTVTWQVQWHCRNITEPERTQPNPSPLKISQPKRPHSFHFHRPSRSLLATRCYHWIIHQIPNLKSQQVIRFFPIPLAEIRIVNHLCLVFVMFWDLGFVIWINLFLLISRIFDYLICFYNFGFWLDLALLTVRSLYLGV